MLGLHIVIALSSIVGASIAIIAPRASLFRINYLLVGLTLASGTYLAISTNAHLLQVCASGLMYVALVSVLVVIARQKLQKAQKLL